MWHALVFNINNCHPAARPRDLDIHSQTTVSARGFGSRIHALGPSGWALRAHRKIAPGDFVNLGYGSTFPPKFKAKNKASSTGQEALFFALNLVGARGFEPPTTCTPCRYATRLRYAPSIKWYLTLDLAF